jgi:HPt (histidine-containing phosphotransfer) domain-containing protein
VRIPIVALTADAMSGAERACLDAGMDGYLTKPLDRGRLADLMDMHLGVRSAGRTASVSAWAPAPSTAEPSPTEPVDWDQLMSVADGDAEFAGQLVQLFIDSGDAALAEIREALRRGDLPAVGRAAHAFKGSSANIRARPASAAAERLEKAARAGTVEQLAALEAALREEAWRAQEYLRLRRA